MIVENLNKCYKLLDKGWVYGIISAFLFSAEATFNNYFFELFTAMEIIFLTSLLKFILITIYCLTVKKNILYKEKKQLKYLIAIGIIYAIALILWIMALEVMSMGSLAALFYSSPIFTAIFCRIFFSDPITCLTIFGIIICICGIGAITQPNFIFNNKMHNEPEPIIGYIMSILGAIFQSIIYTFCRVFNEEIAARYVVTWGFLLQIFITMVFLIVPQQTFFKHLLEMNFLQCVFLLINVTCGCLGEILIFHASQMMRAAFINALESTTLIWMIIFDIWFFNENYNDIAFIGAGALILGLMTLALDKDKIEQVEENKKYLLLNYDDYSEILRFDIG